MSGLKLLFVGESLVLAGAMEKAVSRGHEILGVFSPAALEAAAMRRSGLTVYGPDGDVADFVAAHDCDVLFSIINGHILKPATLALPRLTAVNYHNAPLPAYAGMWATARAVLNGEESHGVTWHIIEPGIDTGAILAQRRFALAAEETTGTLNIKCTEAALATLDEVFEKLEAGDILGTPQDLSRRTYYGRGKAAPNDGVIDGRASAEAIIRLVRACDWGATPNAFGRASAVAPDGQRRLVRSAARTEGSGEPGTILSQVGSTVVVAALDGAVTLGLDAPWGLQTGVLQSSLIKEAPFPRRAPQVGDAGIEGGNNPDGLPTVLDCLALAAASSPNGPAIEDPQSTLSYGDLTKRSEAIAQALLRSGIKAEDGVGIHLPAGAEFVVAALGAMQAGGAYVPLGPSTPSARLAVEIAEAGVTHIVGRGDAAKTLQQFGGVYIDLDRPLGEGAYITTPAIKADRCAYRIFTSGSSGLPKAVEITHGALANLISHYRATVPLGSSDRMTMLANPTFDASVADIWPVLAAGGTLLAPPPRLVLDPSGLIQWLYEIRASCTFVPTAVAERIFPLKWPSDMSLRTLLTGGDTLHHRPPANLPFCVINTYGPTENTVDSLWSLVAPQGGRPAIGRPIVGVTADVIEPDGRPTPPGAIGELMLGGRQLARGYRGRPELTANSFCEEEGSPVARRYRTGDRVRLNAEGEFEFHGRIDDQLQVLGIRVEPGEIEALLKGDTRVLEAACLPIYSANEVTGLIAHVVLAAGEPTTTANAKALKDRLAEQLPAAIVPKTIEFHAALPRSSAGKIDRKALSETSGGSPSLNVSTSELDPIGAAWRRALPLGAPDADDESFWELGGDSLAAMELLIGLEATAGVRLPIGLFLADPTLNGLRREISGRTRPLATVISQGRGPPLILWYTASGDLEDYQHLVSLLGDRTLVGVMSPALTDPTNAPQSLEEAASLSLTAVRQLGIFEPPALLGYSWGGLLAFEAARQLSESGTPSPFVGLIGTLPPIASQSRLIRTFRKAPWALTRVAHAIVEAVTDPNRLAARFHELLRPERSALQRIHFSMSGRYRPSVEPDLEVTLFRERSGPRFDPYGTNRFRADLGWRRWVGSRPNVTWLQGDHLTIMKGAAVAEIAAIIDNALERVD